MKPLDWIWRVVLACVGIPIGWTGLDCLRGVLAMMSGARSDTEWWFLLLIAIFFLVIATACVFPLIVALRLERINTETSRRMQIASLTIAGAVVGLIAGAFVGFFVGVFSYPPLPPGGDDGGSSEAALGLFVGAPIGALIGLIIGAFLFNSIALSRFEAETTSADSDEPGSC